MRTSRIASLAAAGLSLALLGARPTLLHDRIRVAQGYQKRGAEALRLGDLNRAEHSFRKAIEFYPELPDPHMGLGHIAMSRQRFQEALDEYARARDCYAKMTEDLLAARMETYRRGQEERWALEDLRRQLESPAIGVKLAPSLRQMKLTEIEQRSRTLGNMEPPSAASMPDVPGEVHFHIGNALFRLGRLDEALAQWEIARGKTPDFGPLHNNLAVAYWKKGRFEEARESAARAESLGFHVNPAFMADLKRTAGH